ncbi:hypothetical protein K2X89_18255, partial [Myxococcota bacterium]|nr:hypothetical protein [Myxococcota bacterium]
DYDRAVRRASDALARAPLAVRRAVVGRLVVSGEAGLTVRFLSDDAHSIFDVFLADESDEAPRVVVHDPAADLAIDDQRMARARRLALAAPFRACTPTVGDVVLASTLKGVPVWIVYLLATSDDRDLLVMGEHHRIFVDREATTVLDRQALSRSCPIWQRDPTVVAHSISNMGIALPLETHVFTALLYEMELGVFNETRSWVITAGRITERD